MRNRNTFWRRIREWWTPVRVAGLIIGTFGLSVSVFGSVYKGPFAYEIVQAFYANLGTECLSIAVTIIIIDWLYEQRDEQREKSRLVREMRNPDNGLALLAVEELRAQGWLDHSDLLVKKYLWDANLEGVNLIGVDMRHVFLNRANLQRANLDTADLEGAHLERANLSGAHLDKAVLERADMRDVCLEGARLVRANLRRTHLHGASLTGANLDQADLTGAQVTDRELAQADKLHRATLPDGSCYDGRYVLPGDLAAAGAENSGEADPSTMAVYYGISAEAYERGQAWAREQASLIRSKS